MERVAFPEEKVLIHVQFSLIAYETCDILVVYCVTIVPLPGIFVLYFLFLIFFLSLFRFKYEALPLHVIDPAPGTQRHSSSLELLDGSLVNSIERVSTEPFWGRRPPERHTPMGDYIRVTRPSPVRPNRVRRERERDGSPEGREQSYEIPYIHVRRDRDRGRERPFMEEEWVNLERERSRYERAGPHLERERAHAYDDGMYTSTKHRQRSGRSHKIPLEEPSPAVETVEDFYESGRGRDVRLRQERERARRSYAPEYYDEGPQLHHMGPPRPPRPPGVPGAPGSPGGPDVPISRPLGRPHGLPETVG